jgi:hypothetical protein
MLIEGVRRAFARGPNAILGAAEGTSAEIAWIVVYVLCVVLVLAPFALWWAGVRKPRSEKRRQREAAQRATTPADTDTPTR